MLHVLYVQSHRFQGAYKPERKYRRHDADKLRDEESRVQSTLLEYGRRYGFSKSEQKQVHYRAFILIVDTVYK